MSVFQTPRLRSVIIAALCSLTALLSGCSMLRIGYSQAPDLAYWWLDGYVDFNRTQTPRVRDALSQFFDWHRRTQLPDYATLLARARVDVLADTTPARMCEWQATLTARVKTSFDRAAPAIADIIRTLTPEQTRYLEKHYAKTNDDYRSDYLQPDPEKRATETYKRALDRIESLYGRLDDAQRARLASELRRSPFDAEVWFAERRQRQLDVLQLIRQSQVPGGNREQALAGVRAYAERFERSPREAYRAYADRLMEFNCAFAADLHNGTTVDQRRNAADKLAGWEGDVRALIAMPTSAPREPAN